MLGTIINTVAVIVGTLIGRAVGHRFSPRVRETVIHVIGLLTITIGMGNAMQSKTPVALILGLILGALTGEWLRIEDRIQRLGEWCEQRLVRDPEETGGDFARGFVTTSILFCVGPMTILGCIQDGLSGDYRLLAMKSALDGVSSAVFAAALGWGVMLSAVTVLVVQSVLSLGASGLQPVLRDPVLTAELFAAGGVMMLGLGLRLLDLKQVRVANLLPALIYAPLLVWIGRRWF